MWVFVGFETLLFTAYFCVYLFSRTQHEHLFLRQQSHLLGWLGALDTVVLLTSSWAVACAVQHARAGRLAAARRDALLTAACGALFLVLKIAEWVRLVHLGDTFTSGPFFTYYFFLTGIHVVHLLIGFVVLGVLVARLTRPTEGSQVVVETCATYWHTVDFFWVLIFALLYVVR
jgi:nitric oxide reductase NorE protein